MPKLFISYRREDSNNIAGRIYDRLVEEFGKKNVFKDVDSIPLGADFRLILRDAVGQCDVVLSVMGKHWVDATDRAGKMRLEEETDFVRVEIEAALERGIPVIPVLVDGALVPAPEELPAPLRDLSFRNGTPVRYDPDFHHDMDRLIAGLKQTRQTRPARVPSGVKAGASRTSRGRSLVVATLLLLILVSGLLGFWYWRPRDPGNARQEQLESGPLEHGPPAAGDALTGSRPAATTPEPLKTGLLDGGSQAARDAQLAAKAEIDAELASVPEPQRPLAAMLPLDDLPAGWSVGKGMGPSGKARLESFNASNLFEKINGRAESFIDYDVKGMACTFYNPTGDESNEVQLYIFEMGNPLKAFGKYGVDKPDDAKPIAVGTDGYTVAGGTMFYVGPYYTQLVSTKDDPKYTAFALELAKRIAAKQKGVASPPPAARDDQAGRQAAAPTPEAMFALLPAGPKRSNPGYAAADVFGYSFLTDVFMADYQDGDTTWQGFLRLFPSPKAARQVFENYVESANKDGAKVTMMEAEGADKMVRIANLGLTDIIFLKGNALAGANGATEAAKAEAFARSFVKGLPAEVALPAERGPGPEKAARTDVGTAAAPKTKVASPSPPRPSAPAEMPSAPADDAALRAVLTKMAKTNGSSNSIRVALWIASPITKRDLPIFESLAESMRDGVAQLTAVSFPGKFTLQGFYAGIGQYEDPRRVLDLKEVDAMIIYGIYKDNAVVPDFMGFLAPTPSRRVHLAIVWCCKAGKDSFLIVPQEELAAWKPSRLPPADLVEGEDAISAALKYHRIVDVGNMARGNGFREFFGSVRSRSAGPSQISNLVK
ncbi:MAG TPA: toll/interleukin-1 receptor domain-containing protein [Isosphaeraceae bacterium]|jgi:hypothetical protein|nr:toll/interleukin-1 receptor domain-containing protein [Isosphaeraceae bacterium]